MSKTDKRIDAYISKSADFAKPILTYLREVIHKTCPVVQETLKWGMPHFEYKGVLCSMASFKQHCAFGFWKGALLPDPKGILNPQENKAMGHLGQIRSLKDLPSDKVLSLYIKEAMKLNEDDVKRPATKAGERKELVIPEDLLSALKKNKAANKTFESFNYSNKKEYVEWITEAKTDETRKKRLQTSVEWMSEGKIRNWKYMKRKVN